MGVEIRLSDRELPVSPMFIDFAAHRIDQTPFDGRDWADQRSEVLSYGLGDLQRRALQVAPRVMADDRGRAWIARSYHLLLALLTGQMEPLQELQAKFQFVTVIGIPRTGGSYLTAELFRALGRDPEQVPNALAHDGFPEAGPFDLQPGNNGWMQSLQTMAEYLTMVELFFADDPRHSGKVVVPKKLTKAAYAGGYFHGVLGPGVETIITLRHPVAACVSTYEKSGGLPADQRFAVRSNIEDWCRRDLLHAGCTATQVMGMDYFEAYLRYWELYHYQLVTTGVLASRNLRVVPYGPASMLATAGDFHRRYASAGESTAFAASALAGKRHPDWMALARPVVERVAAVCERAGMRFPMKALLECW